MNSYQAKYQSFFKNLPDACASYRAIMDDSGNLADIICTDVNPAFEYLTGLDREEVVNFSVMEKTPEIAKAFSDWLKIWLRSVTYGDSVRRTEFVEPWDKWVEVTACCDEPMTMVLIFRDITETKRAAETLRKSEERFSWAIRNVKTVAVQGFSMDGTTQYWNEASERIFGYTAEEAIGRNVMDLIIPEKLHRSFRKAMEKMIETGEPMPSSQLHLKRRDGSRVTVFSSHAVVSIPGREPELFCMDVDVSDREQAEKMLLQAKYQAEEANAAKSQFLANMSHELKTPMNGLIGMLQMLQLTELDPEQEECVNLALDSSQSLVKLVDDILDYSRMEQGKISLQPALFDVHVLLKEIAGIFHASAVQKGIRFTHTVDPSIPMIMGDPFRIRQILTNLVGNALKFTNAGEVRLTANRMEASNSEQVNLQFLVEDTGIGIPEDKLTFLFERFFQVEENEVSLSGGSGLGLSISKELADLMGGRIRVESKSGKGSRFYFECSFMTGP